MPANYWIKLYHEILDDPKMGRLPDNLWRRTTEVFLLAGDNGADGFLPPVDDMAWRLRLDPELLRAELEQLEEIGIVQIRDDCWYVTNFAARQAPVPDAERQQRYRERLRKEQYYGDANDTDCDNGVTQTVTERNADTDKKRLEAETEENSAGASVAKQRKTRSRKPPEPVPEAVKVFRENAHRYPAKAWYATVESDVGSAPDDLERWGRLVKDWVGRGWNPTNVKGMLAAYSDGGIKDDARASPGRKRSSLEQSMINAGLKGADEWQP